MQDLSVVNQFHLCIAAVANFFFAVNYFLSSICRNNLLNIVFMSYHDLPKYN